MNMIEIIKQTDPELRDCEFLKIEEIEKRGLKPSYDLVYTHKIVVLDWCYFYNN